MFTPQQIKDISFSRAKFGGYDMASVDAFLEPLTNDYLALYKENALLKSKMRVLFDKIEELRKGAGNGGESVAETQKTCDKMLQDAAAECEAMRAEAKAAAEAECRKMLAAAKAAAESASASEIKHPASKIVAIQEQLNAAVAALEQLKDQEEAAKAEAAAEAERKKLPSIERPWMKFYPEGADKMPVPKVNLAQYLKMTCRGEDLDVLHYYGTNITWKRFNAMVEKTARAMRAFGLGEGSQIPVMLQATPEYLAILIAADRIGAALLMRDNTIEENAEAIGKSNATIMFAHDYISQEEVDAYTAVGIQKIITVSPLNYAIQPEMPKHVLKNLRARYPKRPAVSDALISWYEFQDEGDNYDGIVDAIVDLSRPLFYVYTSGSTGPSKQVIHSAQTMLAAVHQLSAYATSDDFRPTWLMAILPPALIAVTSSMLLMPMTSNRLLILDPFVDPEDIDLEIMRYRPNGLAFIPWFLEILMSSKRIPKDYDMSHLLAAGAGCESFNNGQVRRVQKWLNDHGCKAIFSMGFGLSEAGSSLMFPNPMYPATDGSVGMPMPLNNIGIFKGEKECGYNQVGEVCVSTPGMMLGYDNEEATKKTIWTHEDGRVWLHTGDSGYINEDGILYLLGRGYYKRFCGEGQTHKRLVEIVMENIISDAQIPGVKDAFFVFRPDKDHEGFHLPYLFIVLEEGYTVDDVRDAVDAALEPHQRPAAIVQLPARPFYHFKTDRLHMEVPSCF